MSKQIPMLALLAGSALIAVDAVAADAVRTGEAAYGDYLTDAPGVRRHITAKDLPPALATKPSANFSKVVAKPEGAVPKVPAGFKVDVYSSGLKGPRAMAVSPSGDLFVAETGAGNIQMLHEGGGKPMLFASGLNRPFGIAFGPDAANPKYLYVANTDSVVRFPYAPGQMQADGKPEVIVSGLPTGGHSTRDIRFSPDGTKLFISVGSKSNVAEGIEKKSDADLKALEAKDGLGAAWGEEEGRATVLVTSPDGKAGLKHYANGIRNCSGLGIQPGPGPNGGTVWCVNNERDNLGDNLPTEYATSVQEGKFYGWPWYYIGDNEDHRHKDQPRADLKGKVTVPDVLMQPHSAPLQIAFYTAKQFPAEYQGDAFVTLHGSWNRSKRTGYKVVRLPMKDGKPTGEYEDFLTGLVADDANVWARPVGVAVAKDGALFVSEDAGGTVWRISYVGPQKAER
jgi:glucose/arabinose dehydrogenase